jgi:ABC-type Mn2+/Zn2+ transport system permease subunit
MLMTAVVVAVTATVLGTYLALWLRRETGPLIVTVATVCFLLSLTHRQP